MSHPDTKFTITNNSAQSVDMDTCSIFRDACTIDAPSTRIGPGETLELHALGADIGPINDRMAKFCADVGVSFDDNGLVMGFEPDTSCIPEAVEVPSTYVDPDDASDPQIPEA